MSSSLHRPIIFGRITGGIARHAIVGALTVTACTLIFGRLYGARESWLVAAWQFPGTGVVDVPVSKVPKTLAYALGNAPEASSRTKREGFGMIDVSSAGRA